MDGEFPTPRASRFRRLLVDFFRGAQLWAADRLARIKLRAEIDELDRIGLLDAVLGDVNMIRADVRAILNADPQTPRNLEEMLEWLDLADRLRFDERRWIREIQTVCTRCGSADHCKTWLSGDRKQPIEEFCPNAQTFDALLRVESR